MSTDIAFVGDVHGNLRALQVLWEALARRGVPHVVFLGDYINKGKQSAEVLQELILYEETGRATLLVGNHEATLLNAVDTHDLSGFLKIGGAASIRSYVGRRVRSDVFGDFLASLPSRHLEALRRMPLTYETESLVAQHIPASGRVTKFRISAHVPVGDLPRIGDRSAQLDTGCGSASGRLTALMWPEREYIQVNNDGVLITG